MYIFLRGWGKNTAVIIWSQSDVSNNFQTYKLKVKFESNKIKIFKFIQNLPLVAFFAEIILAQLNLFDG